MIVKNEEKVLARCLDSIKEIVDEIIIVDTGSTDKTVEIAKKYTSNVYHFEWIDDFSAARNYAFSKAMCDYIMWLDADDYLEKSEQVKLLALKETFDTSIDVAVLKYNLSFDEFGNVLLSNYRERLLKRERNFKWEEPVHECITPSGNVQRFEIAVTHGEKNRTHSHRNLDIYEKQTKLSPRGTFYYARELHTHNRLEDAIVQFEKFLNSGEGWLEDNITACYDLYNIYTSLDQKEEGLIYLFKTFLYDLPRARYCCKIGEYFIEKEDYRKAVYWYELALNPNSHHEAGFFQKDFCDFIPHMQLCVCFDRLKNHEQSYHHHLKAQELKPDHSGVKYNADFFAEFFPEYPKILPESKEMIEIEKDNTDWRKLYGHV